MSKETWKPAIYNGIALPCWEVSNQGRVRNVQTGKIKSLYRTDNGYPYVCSPPQSFYVHKMVAESYIGPTPPDQMIVSKDGNRANTSLANIELIDKSEKPKRSRRAKLSKAAVDTIRKLIAEGYSQLAISRACDVSNASISNWLSGKYTCYGDREIIVDQQKLA